MALYKLHDSNRTPTMASALITKYTLIHTPKECLCYFIIKSYTQNQWKRNTCISNSFKYWLVNQNFVFIRQLYFTYSIKRLFFVLNDCQYTLFKSTFSKTSYLVSNDWFVFLHRALLAEWVDNIFLTSKYRFPYQNIGRLNLKKLRKLEGRYPSCVWMYTPFSLY